MNRRVGARLRRLPNAITLSRIAAALALLFFRPASAAFIALYGYCGLSDMADGFLARRWNCQSRAGAALDSAADAAFALSIAVKLIPVGHFARWLALWLCAIALVRAAALIVCMLRFRSVRVLHSYSNKAAGLIAFAALPPFCLLSWTWCAVAAASVASVAAIEELCRMALSRKLPERE